MEPCSREKANGVVSDARLEDMQTLNEAYEQPDDLEDACHFRVSSDGDLEETVGRILKCLVQLS